jgi:Plant transposon protein
VVVLVQLTACMFIGSIVLLHDTDSMKEKKAPATIILEAVADYSTWIWHNRFGFPGDNE